MKKHRNFLQTAFSVLMISNRIDNRNYHMHDDGFGEGIESLFLTCLANNGLREYTQTSK